LRLREEFAKKRKRVFTGPCQVFPLKQEFENGTMTVMHDNESPSSCCNKGARRHANLWECPANITTFQTAQSELQPNVTPPTIVRVKAPVLRCISSFPLLFISE
jgi:hypothetical protein